MPRSAAPLFIALSLSTHVLSAGEIRITGQGFEIQDGSAVPSVTRGTQFGDFPVGATQLTRTFVIHNDGGTPLQLNSISENSAHFQLGTVPNPGPIAAGASKSFDLAFNPSSPGVKTATVTVGSDDADEGTYTFVVEGTGLGTPQIEIRGREGAASPWLAITKNATSGSANRGTIFPDTPVNGGLTTSTFQLRNDGDDTLAVSSITSDGADFAVAGVPSSVAAGATETFTIAFNPSKGTDTRFEIYESDDWAEGYDVILHDECSASVTERPYVDRILAAHKAGVPAVNLHCAMHSYRWGDFRNPVEIGAENAGWYEMIGVQSTGHGPQSPIDVSYAESEHPVLKGLSNWTTINEELYNNVRVFGNTEVLATGDQIQQPRKRDLKDNPDAKGTKASAVVVWTNHYGPNKTRIFSTTLGHNNETVGDDRYLELVTRGLMWATDNL